MYADDVPEDQIAHANDHKQLALGGMPRSVREFLKAFGWAVAHNDGGVQRLASKCDAEAGKLAVAYSYWMRARLNGCSVKDFDAFMHAHLAFADGSVSDETNGLLAAQAGIKRWERYAG